MASVFKINATGSAGIASTMTVPAGATYRFISATLHLDGAPTTSENYTITLDANAGAAYDTVLYSLDLSVSSTTDLTVFPDEPLFLEGGDALDIAYTNTDTNTYGLQITVMAV